MLKYQAKPKQKQKQKKSRCDKKGEKGQVILNDKKKLIKNKCQRYIQETREHQQKTFITLSEFWPLSFNWWGGGGEGGLSK